MVQLNIVNQTFDDYYANGGAPITSYVGVYSAAAAATYIPGWTMKSGNVDLLGSSYTKNSMDLAVDMRGSAPVVLGQDIATVPGETYTFSYNIGNMISITGHMEIHINGVALIPVSGSSADIAPPTVAGTPDPPVYTTYTFQFVATGTTTTLDLVAKASSYAQFGPVIGFGTTVCFTRGTMLRTQNATVAIEDLDVGDVVWTESGPQAIKWIYKSTIIHPKDSVLPIIFKAGSLGNNTPCEDLRVSPQHKIKLESSIMSILYDSFSVLLPAKALVNNKNILVDKGVSYVEYYHIAFEKHEIVEANGMRCDSLFIGDGVKDSVNKEAFDELVEIFGDQVNSNYPANHGASFLTVAEGKLAFKVMRRTFNA